MTNQSDFDYQPAPVSLLIAAHCSTIRRKTIHIDSLELSSILDDFVRELNATTSHSETYFTSLNEIILALNATSPPSLLSVTSNYFFILVRNSIQSLLQALHTNYQLNQLATYVLRNSILLFEYLVTETNDVSKLLHWITDQAFLDALGNCLYQIERISKADQSHLFIKQIARLLDMFIDLQERLPANQHNSLFSRLLHPTIKCLTSANYVYTFKDLKPNSSVFHSYQKLLLTRCPHFLTSYNGPRIEKTIEQVLEVMLPRYVSILDTHIRTIKKWRRPVKLAIYHLLTILVFAEGYFLTFLSNELLQTLINHLLRLVNESTLINQIREIPDNSESLLVDAALQVINVLVREPDALDYIKQCKPTMTFRRLLSTPCETIITNTYTILAYSIDENDIKHLDDYLTPLLFTILSALYKAVRSTDEANDQSENNSEYINRNILQLTETLTGLVRHEHVKHEIIKQNALPFLIESSHKLTGLAKQFILESLWTLSFDQQLSQQLRDNSQFIHSLQSIPKPSITSSLSDKNNHTNGDRSYQSSHLSEDDLISWNEAVVDTIYKMANGLLWTLFKESQFRVNTSRTMTEKRKYDVVISYSVKDKDIVSKVKEALTNEGYTVWIDRDILQRQNMENIGEAMNKSTVVIVCLSKWYERDNQCVCESVYASNSKRIIVPLIVERGYEMNSWLMSMIDKSALIQFDVNDLTRSNEIVIKKISQYCKKKSIDKRKLSSKSSTEPKILEQNVLRFAADVIDKSDEPKIVRTSSRTLTSTDKPVLVDKEQQLSWRSKYTKRDTRDATYRSTLINNWKKKDILDFLFDYNLVLMMPLCDSMTGRGLLRFYRICQKKPSRVHAQLNDELRSRYRGLTLPLGVYTQFLIEIDNVLEATSESTQIVTPTPAKNVPQLIFMPITTPATSISKELNGKLSRLSNRSSASLNGRLTETKSDGNINQNTRIIERAIFRPASTADRPYDFIVETGEESSVILEQVKQYAPELYLLQQQVREQQEKSSSYSD
ncbi:hypothetical protein I4U23_024577 [Adineta vaga]|nr:hypothetical protein I4U23_024577 [Adineta vaga]